MWGNNLNQGSTLEVWNLFFKEMYDCAWFSTEVFSFFIWLLYPFLYRIEKWNDPFSRVFCSYFLFISLLPFPVFFSHNSPPLCPVALGNNHKYIMEMAMSLVSDQTFVFPSVSDSRRLGSLRWIHERVQRGVPCISSLLYS